MTEIGHNSRSISAEHLEQFVRRIERLNEERAGLTADTREVYAEAKGSGFDTRTMREVIRLRAMDPSDMIERRSMVELYLEALGVSAP